MNAFTLKHTESREKEVFRQESQGGKLMRLNQNQKHFVVTVTIYFLLLFLLLFIIAGGRPHQKNALCIATWHKSNISQNHHHLAFLSITQKKNKLKNSFHFMLDVDFLYIFFKSSSVCWDCCCCCFIFFLLSLFILVTFH